MIADPLPRSIPPRERCSYSDRSQNDHLIRRAEHRQPQRAIVNIPPTPENAIREHGVGKRGFENQLLTDTGLQEEDRANQRCRRPPVETYVPRTAAGTRCQRPWRVAVASRGFFLGGAGWAMRQ